jgi:hypothetical protein
MLRLIAKLVTLFGWISMVSDVSAQSMVVPQSTSVRSSNARLAGALVDGITRSDTLRHLVATLDTSNLIVYLHNGNCPRPAEACLMIVRTAGDTRLVHINFRIAGYGSGTFLGHQDRLIAQVGHELQHAVEIAGDREVIDTATLTGLYDRIGRRRESATRIGYETEAAIDAGQRVLRDIHAARAVATAADMRANPQSVK